MRTMTVTTVQSIATTTTLVLILARVSCVTTTKTIIVMECKTVRTPAALLTKDVNLKTVELAHGRMKATVLQIVLVQWMSALGIRDVRLFLVSRALFVGAIGRVPLW
jgi:hypothetical protein